MINFMTLLYYSLLITLPCRNPKKIIYSFRFDTWKPIKGTLFFEVDTNITVTGVGLVISPGADVTVTLQAKGPTYLWGNSLSKTTKRVKNTGNNDVVPVYLENPIYKRYCMRDVSWQIDVEIKGKGVARVAEKPYDPPPLPEVIIDNFDEVTIDGRNQLGNTVGEVTFQFSPNNHEIFSELYFYVNSKQLPPKPTYYVSQPGPSRRYEDDHEYNWIAPP